MKNQSYYSNNSSWREDLQNFLTHIEELEPTDELLKTSASILKTISNKKDINLDEVHPEALLVFEDQPDQVLEKCSYLLNLFSNRKD